MKGSMSRKIVFSLILVALLVVVTIPAGAQSPNPPAPDPNSAWAGVFNPDGTLNSSLKDGGQMTQQASWMPSVLGVSIPATYHVYYTSSGNTVVIPNAITEFFMNANPQESGLSEAASEYESSGGFITDILGQAAGGQPLQTSLGQNVSPDQFAQDMISGQANIWSLSLSTAFNTLNLLASTTLHDQDLYLAALLYTSDECAEAPRGCTAQNLPPSPPPAPAIPPPSKCPAPSVRPGAISYGGSKTYPPYPLVVGQDPSKTGVDVSFHASVAPTIYIYYIQVPIRSCETGPDGAGNYDCGGGSGHMVTTGYRCVQQSRSYNECIASASGSISLSSASRDWILNTLSVQYPEAYIHKPYFGFGGSGCAWSASGQGVQIDDPGAWLIAIAGRTSGTPVSGPRGFSGGGSPFDVWLKEVEIIH